MQKHALLADRAVIAVSGTDRVAFLQGLVSNDVTHVARGRAVWAALLSPQGKWRADFFIHDGGTAFPDTLLIDCERGQAESLATALTRFRLRSKVTLDLVPGAVIAIWDGDAPTEATYPGAIIVPDPRLAEAGWRAIVPADTQPTAEFAVDDVEWDRHRLLLGLPDGSRDLDRDKTVLLEAGFDELNGVSWTKGCYMGQELTARTRYRGLIKKRLVPVAFEGPAPAPFTPILHEGLEVGSVRSSRDALGLALLRVAHLHAPLYLDDRHKVGVHLPEWIRLPEPGAEGTS